MTTSPPNRASPLSPASHLNPRSLPGTSRATPRTATKAAAIREIKETTETNQPHRAEHSDGEPSGSPSFVTNRSFRLLTHSSLSRRTSQSRRGRAAGRGDSSVCAVSVPVSRNGSGTYATSEVLLLGRPPGLFNAPNSLSLSLRARWVRSRSPSWVIWTVSPTTRTPSTCPM